MNPPLTLGPTVVCIGSGPSLTSEDCEAIRHLPTIVTNSTFRLCPWADVLIAHDIKWWQEHGAEATRVFAGRRFGGHKLCERFGAESLHHTGFQWFGLTGCGAIHLALNAGARRILLLGYDASRSGGRSHHFGSHPPALSDCRSIKEWPQRLARVAALARRRRATVINCSRQTILTCFERQSLEQALGVEEAVAA